jgi:O-antigen/teichoic acid export membrane protein
MAQSIRLRRNIVAVLAQTIVVAICLFLSYRILVQSVGLAMIGLWSLLLSVTSVLRTADVSGSSALSRFLALPPDKRPGELEPLFSTVFVFSTIINLFLIAIFLIGMTFFVTLFVPASQLETANELLPFAAILMFLSSSSLAVTAALDGMQRADQRAIVVTLAAVGSLLAAWLLVPSYGAVGFAIAQILQQLAILFLCWGLLRKAIPRLGFFPKHMDWGILRHTMPYTLTINATGVASILFEPLAKFALNHTGGLELVGQFELANRLCVQLRGLAVSAAAPLVPAFASFSGKDDQRFLGTISRSHRVFALLASGLVLAVAVGTPILSTLVLGRIDNGLVLMAAVLAFGWSVNMLATPTYFAAQGQGKLGWNFASHVWLGLCVVLGIVLPSFAQVPSVVWGITAGLATGAALTIFGNGVSLGIIKNMKADAAWLVCAVLVAASLLALQLYVQRLLFS